MELGILLALAATLGWGAGDVFARKAMFGARAEVVLAAMIAIVVVSLGIVVVLLEGFGALAVEGIRFYLLVAFMGLFTWVGGNLLYFHGMRLAGVVLAAPVLGAAPLIAILLAVVFGGERPDGITLVGAFAVVLGVGILVTDPEQKRS